MEMEGWVATFMLYINSMDLHVYFCNYTFSYLSTSTWFEIIGKQIDKSRRLILTKVLVIQYPRVIE